MIRPPSMKSVTKHFRVQLFLSLMAMGSVVVLLKTNMDFVIQKTTCELNQTKTRKETHMNDSVKFRDILDNFIDNRNLSQAVKTILLWNSFWDTEMWEFAGKEDKAFTEKRCPETRCILTDDRSRLNTSDAVLFHIPQLDSSHPPVRPIGRGQHQRWVFFSLEPPTYDRLNDRYKTWTDVFNWTMTYRLDSDIPVTYGLLSKAGSHAQRNIGTILLGKPNIDAPYGSTIQGKKKLVAWFVSHCKSVSKRQNYVQELSKYIPVDIYGSCSPQNLSCPLDLLTGEHKCLKMLHENYFFYLSFEGSFCTDYVTEKLFKLLPLDIVPVVRGLAQYDKFVPHNWIINTKDFSSPKKLTNYLINLANDTRRYLDYFKGREQYTIASLSYTMRWPRCELCQKLHDPTEPVTYYADINSWWNRMSDCKLATGIDPLQRSQNDFINTC